MSNLKVYLLRHGETAWSKSKKHTSFTDLSLTEHGRWESMQLAKRIKKTSFSKVLVSPLKRAQETTAILGLEGESWSDLTEWNYGRFEGLTTLEIRKEIPDWSIFTHGATNGESLEDIKIRADRVIEKILTQDGTIAIISSAHILRVIAARWIELPVTAAKGLLLSTASLSILGFEHQFRAIQLWNDTDFLS